MTLLAVRVTDGPNGPFSFAQVRVSCRSGARARALVVATAVDAAPATAAWLAGHWGIAGRGPSLRPRLRPRPCRLTMVRRRPRGPAADRRPRRAVRRRPPPGHDRCRQRLAQVELEVDLQRVERGRPELRRFDAPAGAAALAPRFAVAATSGVGTLTLPQVRFVLRPDVPAHLGTERIGQRASA